MPYQITWEETGVYCHFWGDIETANVVAMLRDVARDERFDEIHYWLSDYLDVTGAEISLSEIDEITAREFAQNFSNSRYYGAAVANDPNILALLDYWITNHPDRDQMAYFTNLEQARAWIAAQPGLEQAVVS